MQLPNPPSARRDTVLPLHRDVRSGAWAVDASCSGNPGKMEYRGVDLQTGVELFRYGPVIATNNIGEFLAIVHALALMDRRGITDKAVYSDSVSALAWVRKKHCNTRVKRTARTLKALELVERAEKWLLGHDVKTPVLKWDTVHWGEIPADFGRK